MYIVQRDTGPSWREHIRKVEKTSTSMSRSVRIGGYHQIAELETIETLGEFTRVMTRVVVP